MASSGLINPVTGRKYVKSWMIDELIESALDFYSWSEEVLGKKYFHRVEIIRSLHNQEALKAWKKRLGDPEYSAYISEKRNELLDRKERPYGIVTGAFRLDAPAWLLDCRMHLRQLGVYEELAEPYVGNEQGNQIVIWATGSIDNSISEGLIPNKGEALVVRISDWEFTSIVKEDVFFIPLREEHHYWVGSYYDRWPSDHSPSAEGKKQLMEAIEFVYKGSFVIKKHLSGTRPTVDDRRPLVGPWPGRNKHYIFNGMGTKGTSLAPFWARHLMSHIVSGTPLIELVNPSRYKSQP
jgi:glycine/D-amino acid oxidase-like deaminating enzyme